MEEMHRNCFQILASGLGPGRTTPFMSGSASEKQQGKEKDVQTEGHQGVPSPAQVSKSGPRPVNPLIFSH